MLVVTEPLHHVQQVSSGGRERVDDRLLDGERFLLRGEAAPHDQVLDPPAGRLDRSDALGPFGRVAHTGRGDVREQPLAHALPDVEDPPVAGVAERVNVVPERGGRLGGHIRVARGLGADRLRIVHHRR